VDGCALTVGGFALAGIPPLTGFLGRWAQTALLATAEPLYFVVVLARHWELQPAPLREWIICYSPRRSLPHPAHHKRERADDRLVRSAWRSC